MLTAAVYATADRQPTVHISPVLFYSGIIVMQVMTMSISYSSKITFQCVDILNPA